MNIIRKIRSDVEAIGNDRALFADRNFRSRTDALDFLEFGVLDRLEHLLSTTGMSEELSGLKEFAEGVKTRLEDADKRFFRKLRAGIASRSLTGSELRNLLYDQLEVRQGSGNEAFEGYDRLDAFVNGLLLRGAAPEEVREREPEMIPYQPTPSRIVLELVEKARFQPHEVFFDIGSGLGQVAMLVHLLGGVRAKGVEFEPAFSEFAGRCAQELNLSEVEFINADAREVGYADAAVCYMYSPFEGGMLEQVLGRLRDETRTRGIRLFTYGPCTRQVAQQGWLERVDHNGSQANRLGMFKTRDS